MDVSIIIVNYNTKDLCINCIKSVYENTKDVEYEIIVVDNNSSDNSVKEITAQYSGVKVISNKENVGFAKANNEGFKYISEGSKYVFYLNPDTLLVNNSIKILFDFMEQNPDCGAVGGSLYNKNMERVFSFGYGDDIISLLLRKTPLKYLFRKEYCAIKNYAKTKYTNNPIEVNHITGADLMLRKSVIDAIGYFSNKFFMYFEETELEVRIRRAGYKVFFVPESKIIHLEDKYRNNKHKSNYFYESFVEYYRVCYGEAWGEIAKFLIRKRFL